MDYKKGESDPQVGYGKLAAKAITNFREQRSMMPVAVHNIESEQIYRA
jgi:hypothetical protein